MDSSIIFIQMYFFLGYCKCVASQVVPVVKNPPVNAGDTRDRASILGWEGPQEEEVATHSSILAGDIPWTEEPGGLQPMRLQRVRHAHTHTTQVHTQCTHTHPEYTLRLMLSQHLCGVAGPDLHAPSQ